MPRVMLRAIIDVVTVKDDVEGRCRIDSVLREFYRLMHSSRQPVLRLHLFVPVIPSRIRSVRLPLGPDGYGYGVRTILGAR